MLGSSLYFSLVIIPNCVASDKEEAEYLNKSPEWVKKKAVGEAKIGEPVGG